MDRLIPGLHWVFQQRLLVEDFTDCMCLSAYVSEREGEIEVTSATPADDGGKETAGEKVESADSRRGSVDGLKCSVAKSNAA